MKRQVIIKMCKFNMFITAVCVLFLIKLRWPKNKNIYNNIEGPGWGGGCLCQPLLNQIGKYLQSCYVIIRLIAWLFYKCGKGVPIVINPVVNIICSISSTLSPWPSHPPHSPEECSHSPGKWIPLAKNSSSVPWEQIATYSWASLCRSIYLHFASIRKL